jgi:hypothetical protein
VSSIHNEGRFQKHEFGTKNLWNVISDVNINNEECFSFRYWAYDDYKAGTNICMTHYRAT